MWDRQGATVVLDRGSPGVCSGTIQGRQDATILLIRSVDASRMLFWQGSGFPDGCPPTWNFLQ
eukprot:7240989-Pyramimonas_sp.AAC.1